MTPRAAFIAVLLVVEIAIVGEAGFVLRGTFAPTGIRRAVAQGASGSQVAEGGPHRVFAAAVRPTLTVDIGYADLTILTSPASRIDVSVTPAPSFGIFQATAPFSANAEGGAIHIAASGGRRSWGMGDNRMMTIVVPADTQVTVINAGNIRAEGLRAEASFNSIGSGGTLSVEDYDAPALHVACSNGRIVLNRIVAARLDASIEHGRVEGTELQIRDGSVESNGRVTLGFAPGADTQVTAETSNGRVSVSGFRGPATLATGDENAGDPSSQTVRIGAGSGHLVVHSSNGNIALAQEG